MISREGVDEKIALWVGSKRNFTTDLNACWELVIPKFNLAGEEENNRAIVFYEYPPGFFEDGVIWHCQLCERDSEDNEFALREGYGDVPALAVCDIACQVIDNESRY